MSSTVDPLKLLNRGPAYLRSAFQTQTTNKTNTPTLSAAERLNVRKKTIENKEENRGEVESENVENAKKKQKNSRPTTAPPTVNSKSDREIAKRSEFETWTAEQLVNRGTESKSEKQGGYAARMLANTRPKSAMPYSLAGQPTRRARAPVRGNHNLMQPRERSNSVDRFFDTLGGTFMDRSNPPSLVLDSVSDLSGLSRAASQNIRSRSTSSSIQDGDESPDLGIKAGNKKPEVSQVEKRIRVMMWLSNCKPQPHFSTPVKG